MTPPPLPIELEPHETGDHSAAGRTHYQWVYRFPNGYGASVVWGTYLYCDARDGAAFDGKSNTYELAIVRFDGDNRSICYDTDITDDVLRWQSIDEVAAVLMRIAGLPS